MGSAGVSKECNAKIRWALRRSAPSAGRAGGRNVRDT
jgi:hypothetical protein